MKSHYLHLVIAYAVAGCLASCGSSKEMATSDAPGIKKVACGKIAIEAGAPHIDWFEANSAGLEKNKELKLPAAYSVYSVEDNQVKRFFEAAAANQVKTVVPLGNNGCQVFTVKRSGAMSPELAEKYPGLVSLSGTGVNGIGDLRLDFDGTKMNGQVIWKDQVYLITPVDHNRKRYYIIYKKSDSAEEKQPFESVTK